MESPNQGSWVWMRQTEDRRIIPSVYHTEEVRSEGSVIGPITVYNEQMITPNKNWWFVS